MRKCRKVELQSESAPVCYHTPLAKESLTDMSLESATGSLLQEQKWFISLAWLLFIYPCCNTQLFLREPLNQMRTILRNPRIPVYNIGRYQTPEPQALNSPSTTKLICQPPKSQRPETEKQLQALHNQA